MLQCCLFVFSSHLLYITIKRHASDRKARVTGSNFLNSVFGLVNLCGKTENYVKYDK